MRCFLVAVFLLALLLLPETADAQTDYSLRIRSLSTHLSGIVDDPLTDAYLNPARLVRFNGTHLYGVRLPSITLSRPFPVSVTNDLRFGPLEESTADFSFEPLAFSIIHSFPESMVLSAAVQLSVSGREISGAFPTYDLNGWNQQSLEQRLSVRDQTDDGLYLLFDFAAATKGRKSLGLRLTGSHASYRDHRLNSTSYYSVYLENMTDTELYETYYRDFDKYEVTDIALSAGAYRPDDRLSDLSVGAAVCRRLSSASARDLMIDDTDSDRNGDRIGGGSPYLRVVDNHYATERDYLGMRVFARAHWNARKNIRVVNSIEWHRSGGDGRAEFTWDDLYYGAYEDIDSRGGGYAYDGTLSGLAVTTAVGYSREIREGFSAVIGLEAGYSRDRFEEDGGGNAHLFLDQSNGSYDSLYYSSPYLQKHDNEQDMYTLVIPVGCEWQVHEYIRLRLGIELNAYRGDNEQQFYKSVAAIDLPSEFEGMGTEIGRTISYGTNARFNNGLEINLRDKLIVELLAFSSHSSYVRFAEYGFVSVRYRF